MRFKGFVVITLIAALVLAGCASSTSSKKDQYPNKPFEYVVHAGAGGSSDVFARTVADVLTKEKFITTPISVVNKVGGAGAVAIKYTASKAGDPYILFNMASTFITTPQVSKDCPNYSEFTPIALFAVEPDMIAVGAASPYKTLKDLVEASKTKPDGITFSVASVGSYDHLVQLRFAELSGGKVVGLPFTSDSEAMVAVLGGHADATAITPRVALPQVKAGKLRILAITSEKRYEAFPDVPTMKELGMDIILGTPRGVVAPGKLKDNEKQFLIETFKKVANTERWQKFLKDEYLIAAPLFGADFEKFIKTDTEKTGPLLKAGGLIK